MKRSISRAVVGAAILALGLTGCNSERYPAYSSGVKYGVRTDPIIRIAKDLFDDRFEPDRPGLMPVMKIDDMLRADHPYNPKLVSGSEDNLRKVAYVLAAKELPIKKDAKDDERKVIDDQRKRRQDELLPKVRSNPGAYKREFQEVLDKWLRFPTLLNDDGKKVIEQSLEAMFGTPAKPIVNAKEAGIDEKTIADLKLDDDALARGSSYYRVHCLHCHGVPGNGRGPTARWINPHPRDFRGGVFKFQSTDRASGIERQPTRADLLRTLREGIEGTAMPSFRLLPDDELDKIISYVIHLSIRGRVESSVILGEEIEFDADNGGLKVALDENGKPADIPAAVKFWTKKFVTDGWAESQKAASAIVVKSYPYDEKDQEYMSKILPASVKRGQEIFTGKPSDETKEHFAKHLLLAKRIAESKPDNAKQPDLAKLKAEVEKDFPNIDKELKKGFLEKAQTTLAQNCHTCHIDYGRKAQYKPDDWGTLVRPRDFTLGVFRGGKRPVDIYYRIHSGIPGTVMVSYGKSPFEGHEQYMWDLVNFIQVLPYPDMRKSFGIKLD